MKRKQTLARREREIMDILYRDGALSANEVAERLSNSPSNSAVRTLLRILEEKGHVKREQEAMHYVYHPSVSRERAGRSALRHLMSTFFDNSPETVVSNLLDETAATLSTEQLDALARLIEQEKKGGR